MNIQGMGGTQGIAQLLMNSGMSGTQGPPQGISQGGPPAQITSIQNDQGQSMIDIRDELQEAVKTALEDSGGEGDVRATVENAINKTLEEHGFDPDEVKSAMQDSGFSPMQGMAMRGGNSMQGMMGGSGPHGAGGGTDLASLLDSTDNEEDLVQSFLQQLRAGTNLDMEI